MTDTAKVIRLEPEVQRHIRARLARLPAGVHAFNDAGKKLLEDLLVTYFDSVDDDLFDLADKAESNKEQNLYFDSMREVRVQRKSIERRFLETVQEGFARLVGMDDRDALKKDGELSPEVLSLVQNEDIEQLVAAETVIARASEEYRKHILFASQRLTPVVPVAVDDKNYPFGPQVLCTSMLGQIKRLDISIKAKLALFDLFDSLVIQNLNSLYSQLEEVLSVNGFSSDKSAAMRDSPEPSDVVAPTVKSEGASDISMPEIRAELYDVLTFVQKLPVSPAKAAEGIDILRVMKSVQQHRGTELQLTRVETECINLVQKMFSFILKDHHLAQPLCELLCRLQVPVLKTALIEADFLQDKRHPARIFLNDFVSTSVEWGSTAKISADDALYTLMCSMVDRIAAYKKPSREIYKSALADLTAFIEAEQKRTAVLEKRTVDAEDGKARAEAARKAVADEVQRRTAAHPIPSVVMSLIRGPWSNVIFVTGLKYGSGSAEQEEQLKVLSELIWSVQPCSDKSDRQKLIRLIPELLQRLRRGLDFISYNPFEVSELFAGLEEIHLARIRGAAIPEDTNSKQPVEALEEPQLDKAQLDEPHLEEATLNETLEQGTKPPEEEGRHDESKANVDCDIPDDDPDMRAVARFSQGAWFDLSMDCDEVIRCRLAAYIKPTGKYIFVNRSGSKVAEKTQQELARGLKENKLRAVDNAMLFDKALENVVSGLRKSQSNMPLDSK